MNVVVFGATGMVGAGVLIECLEDPGVSSVLAVGRRPTGRTHHKVREIVVPDLERLPDVADQLRDLAACFFCAGVSSTGMTEAAYRHVTYDLTIGAAELLAASSPRLTFCYVSGLGTDSTEQGSVMWARVKGATENRLLTMPISAYMFRPGFIRPMKGVRSVTRSYRAFYAITRPIFPMLERFFPRQVTTTAKVGRAMIRVARQGYEKRVLETVDINRMAAAE